jgi:hypothetical protein
MGEGYCSERELCEAAIPPSGGYATATIRRRSPPVILTSMTL